MVVKQKKIPLRTSLASGKQFPKKELLRVAYTKEGEISIDPTGKAHGRGAYIGLSTEEAELAKKKKVFNRAFSTEVSDEFYDELILYVKHEVGRKELANKVYSAELAPDYD
ncbi:RNase P modulator RnpM [Lactovum odontotermitis]